MNTPKAPFRKYPYECDHPITEREYKPDARDPKLITCKVCGAILFMQLADGQELYSRRWSVPIRVKVQP